MACPDCTTGSILPGEPTGTLSTQGAYFTSGLTGEMPSKRAVLLLTDGFGLPLKNSKILADNLATCLGCDVWVPDYFEGKPLIALHHLLIPDRAGVKMGVLDWLKFVLIAVPRVPAFISSRPSVVDARLAKFVAAIQAEKKYEKIGAVGYCYGGSTAIRLGATDLVRSIVICHPGGFTIPEAQAIKVPAAWVCAEDDLFFSKDLRLKTEAIFGQRKGKDNFIEYEFKDYKGTAHGFAARPNLALPEVKEAHEKAFEQTVEWFQKTLTI
ncbi:dienelactone hydrolase endo-1,3,1,4-beta-D-glucanase [Collybia nuda]|uniref:Dienelactone hydrolase endo-1,3,1,4-beta-D-glucanase n=1 Tax=Collybia nuda TaxID=64659 RepID=A0A9P6CA04_9AGAR|nr:dienelactone hydrolase endo-1,3,1,4-beta-D-glucanase [Collybia nuda]